MMAEKKKRDQVGKRAGVCLYAGQQLARLEVQLKVS